MSFESNTHFLLCPRLQKMQYDILGANGDTHRMSLSWGQTGDKKHERYENTWTKEISSTSY